MLVISLKNTEDRAVHLRTHTVVGSEKNAVLIFNKELTRSARCVRGLRYTGCDIYIHVRIFVQQRTQTRPVVTHIQIVASDENRVRVLTNSILEGLYQLVVTQAVSRIYVPYYGIQQTVVRLVHRQVHPVRLCDMDADWHLQLACFSNQRFDTRVVNMNTRAIARTSVRIAFALVAQLTYTDRTHLMIALQRLASLLNTFLTHVGIIETAPETETILVSCISRYILLKRTTDPGAMHHSRVQHAYLVHRLAPLSNLLFTRSIIMSVHIDNIEFSALHIGHRQVIHYHRSEILQQNLVRRTCAFFCFLSITCRHCKCGENEC